ncbi:hypothetical protein HC928_01735, partial [bacterium]|nr:hypothetical protein [bacterium]
VCWAAWGSSLSLGGLLGGKWCAQIRRSDGCSGGDDYRCDGCRLASGRRATTIRSW